MIMSRLKTSLAEKVAIYSLRLARRDGPLGRDLYNELGFYLTSIGIEAVALRRASTGRIEVYLAQRAVDDVYPLQWHCPGSVLRRQEYIDNVMDRLAKQEFKATIHTFAYVDEFLHQEHRGWFLTKIYFVDLGAVPPNDSRGWFSVDNLPSSTVAHHANIIIPHAVQYYRQYCVPEEVHQ
jgi:ADP-ribose pyrophosphatase YjhB (NUDIX family)